MRIHVFTLCYNEEVLAPYFIKHYDTFADKITVYNNQSTDGSVDILRQCGKVEIVNFESHDQCNEILHTSIRNHSWKPLRHTGVDWVIWVDFDEFIYYDGDIRAYYEECQGKVALLTTGYNMVAQSPPVGTGQIYDEIRRGIYDQNFCKCGGFEIDRVGDIEFSTGGHCVRGIVDGAPIQPWQSDLKLLHYVYLGLDYHWNRWQKMSRRLSEVNKAHGFGCHYDQPRENLEHFYTNLDSWPGVSEVLA